MSHRRGPDIEAPGQDSFLDVVANLVGILVILVMVIGVRARGALTQNSTQMPLPTQQFTQQISQLHEENAALTLAAHQTQHEIERIEREAAARQIERDRLQTLLVIAQRQQQMTSPPEQNSLQQLRHELADSELELERIRKQLEAAEIRDPQPEVLRHIPTPLAKTVFGHEEHFRLKDGHLAYVPMDAMVNELKREAMRKIPQLRTVDQVTETLGPMSGFHVRYSLRRRQVVVQTETGRVARDVAELAWFELLPVREPLGEPIDTAMSRNSQLALQTAQWPVEETIITIWTYPRDFGDFRRIKDYLQAQGFLIAGRPLPDGQPITGSPDGTRSVAQ